MLTISDVTHHLYRIEQTMTSTTVSVSGIADRSEMTYVGVSAREKNWAKGEPFIRRTIGGGKRLGNASDDGVECDRKLKFESNNENKGPVRLSRWRTNKDLDNPTDLSFSKTKNLLTHQCPTPSKVGLK